jgi:hypothetical protein
MNTRLLLLIVVILFLSCVLWMGRYSIFPTNSMVGAYKLNRFTGEVTLLYGGTGESPPIKQM